MKLRLLFCIQNYSFLPFISHWKLQYSYAKCPEEVVRDAFMRDLENDEEDSDVGEALIDIEEEEEAMEV